MGKSIVNEKAGVAVDAYYIRGAVKAPGVAVAGADGVPAKSFSTAPEPKSSCYMTKKDGAACPAPVVKGTDLCIGHTNSLHKAAQS
jgi:hypothetical protein